MRGNLSHKDATLDVASVGVLEGVLFCLRASGLISSACLWHGALSYNWNTNRLKSCLPWLRTVFSKPYRLKQLGREYTSQRFSANLTAFSWFHHYVFPIHHSKSSTCQRALRQLKYKCLLGLYVEWWTSQKEGWQRVALLCQMALQFFITLTPLYCLVTHLKCRTGRGDISAW